MNAKEHCVQESIECKKALKSSNPLQKDSEETFTSDTEANEKNRRKLRIFASLSLIEIEGCVGGGGGRGEERGG